MVRISESRVANKVGDQADDFQVNVVIPKV
jgi:hypothetical protein